MSNDVSLRVKAQRLGGKLSAMVLPNLGAFMGWGILTALGIWLSNDMLKAFISPVLTYLLPLLIAISGGKMIYGEKGAVIGAFTTMGVIIGADISMLLGAMIIAPLSAWLLKKLDAVVEPLIPVGFELLIGNLTVALLGAVIAIIGCVWIAPAIYVTVCCVLRRCFHLGKQQSVTADSDLHRAGEVLFLNNAIGQGILTPLGTTQLNEFEIGIVSAGINPGPGLGILLAYCFWQGNAKANAYGASIIHFFGGIHEIYFPFILMNPLTVLAAIAGGITGTFLFTLFNVGLVSQLSRKYRHHYDDGLGRRSAADSACRSCFNRRQLSGCRCHCEAFQTE